MKEGVHLFEPIWEKFKSKRPSRRTTLISLILCLLLALIWIFFLSPFVLEQLGWLGGYWNFVFLGFVIINLLVSFFIIGVIFSFLIAAHPTTQEENNETTSSIEARNTLIIALILTFLVPGAVAAITLSFVLIRAIATIRFIGEGLKYFLLNWTTLILKTDLTTEPEILPGLPPESPFSFKSMLSMYHSSGSDPGERYASLISLSVFAPSIAYRLILKSSFWFYAPLLWVAAPPRGLLLDDTGRFRWDRSLAHTPVDIAAALVALIGAFFFFFRVWDQTAYSTASRWAAENGFPAYWPMLAAGIDPRRVDLWHLLPGIAALLSLVVFLWAWQISARHRHSGHVPSQFTLWCIYKLNSAKNTLSVLLVACGIYVLFLYYGENCLLPAPLQHLIGTLLGMSCSPVPV